MSRTGITTEALAAIQAPHVKLCILVELQFADDTLRFNNGTSPVSWGGHTWIGAGNFTAMEPVEESTEPRAAGMKLRFSGLNTELLDLVVNEHYAGRPARIWIALMDEFEQVIDDPIQVFAGSLDNPQITSGETFDIDLALENRWADWDRPRVRRYNDPDHQSRNAGDKFFEYAAAMEAAEFVWGIYKGPAAPKVPSITDYARKTGGNLLFAVNRPFIQPFIKPITNFFRKLF